MSAFFDRMRAQLREYFEKTSKKDKIRMAILALVIIALAIVVVTILSRTSYAMLIEAQSDAEAGEVIQVLQDMGIPARVEGRRILVPEDKANELRVILSSQQVIGPGDTDYSILYSAAGFSVTDSQAKKIYEAHLESQIRAAVLESDRILNAKVIANRGESSPFLTLAGAREATCAVMLTTRGGVTLEKSEVQAIATFVRNAIPGIPYENITITDNNLNLYQVSEPGEEEDEEALDNEMRTRIALENLLKQQLQAQGEQFLTPIFGMSNVAITANVRLNFDKVIVESIEFDPPVPGELDGIIRSQSEMYETSRRDPAAEGIPGTDTNGMGVVEYPYGEFDDGLLYTRAVNERNYEINETRTLIEKERGTIQSLNIGVTLNSDEVDEEYVDSVANLISRGMGIPIENVAVERIPFYKRDTMTMEELYAKWEEYEEQMRQEKLFQTIVIWGVVLLLGLALMLLIRSIVKILHPPPPPIPEPMPVEGPIGVGIGIDYIADDESITDLSDFDEEITDISEEEELELNKKSTGLDQIEKFIDRDAASVALLLRNWLSDE